MQNKKIKSILAQRQGFTLIELIAVISIVGVLAAAAVPSIGNAIERSQVTQVSSDIKVVSDAVSMYIQETGAVPIVNLSADKINLQSKDDGQRYSPGVSVNVFRKNVKSQAPNMLYLVDMSKLTNTQININDINQVVAPKLNTIPTSSSLKDIDDANGNVLVNNSVKNTTVTYAVDKDMRVYALSNSDLSKSSITETTKMPTVGTYKILNPSDAMLKIDTTKNEAAHEVFKVAATQVPATNLTGSVSWADKAYKN